MKFFLSFTPTAEASLRELKIAPHLKKHFKAVVKTLKFLQENNVLKKITVDMGAVKFVVNGADIMRPGIVEIEDGIMKNDFVAVVDVNNKKPLAVGIALYDAYEMKGMKNGKAVKNIHYVGDELWQVEMG